MSSTILPVCPKTSSTSPSLTVHLCLHTAPGNRECALLVLAPSGNPSQGVVIGSIYRGSRFTFDKKTDWEAAPEGQHQLPSQDEARKIHRRVYRDGTRVSFDREEHRFDLELKAAPARDEAVLTLSAQLKEKIGTCSVGLGTTADPPQVERHPPQLDIQLSASADHKEGRLEIAAMSGTSVLLKVGDTEVAIEKEKIALKATEGEGHIEISAKSAVSLTVGATVVAIETEQITLTSKKILLNGGTTTLVVNDSGVDVT